MKYTFRKNEEPETLVAVHTHTHTHTHTCNLVNIRIKKQWEDYVYCFHVDDIHSLFVR